MTKTQNIILGQIVNAIHAYLKFYLKLILIFLFLNSISNAQTLKPIQPSKAPPVSISKPNSTPRVLLNSVVGEFSGGYITSRYVNMSYFLESTLFSPKNNKAPKLYSLGSKEFAKEVTAVLIEHIVYEDSKNFSNIQISDGEVKTALAEFRKKFLSFPDWKNLNVSDTELTNLIIEKVQSKKYIKFKAESSLVPITKDEARLYFEENRNQFGELPFENFEQNIRAFLGRKQADKRIKEWFEVLQGKYKVRNLLVETF